MDTLDDWFPYETYRPQQRQMLEAAKACAGEGEILMIDAPTGSGKSSVVAALLAEAQGRKVLVAVRTVSQLHTFIRELELIRKKKKKLTFAYLIGKGNMCPMVREGNAYRLCEGLKAFSTSLMRDRAQKGSLVPSKDPVVRQQIKKNSPEQPMICPYFIRSRVYADSGEGLKMIPSQTLRTKAEQACRQYITPERLGEFAGTLCPYELMLQAARGADVVLFNFYHLFDEGIRQQIYQSLEIEDKNALLLIDEAHNCGDTIQNIQSVTLEERHLELAMHELNSARSNIAGAEAILALIPHISRFIESLKRSWKDEDWFDPAIFTRSLLNGSLYQDIEEIVDDLLRITDTIRERNVKAGEFRETAVERFLEFFYRILCASSDSAYLTVYRRIEDSIALEVRNIDPAKTLQEVVDAHAGCVLISGTLSPINSYSRLYFEGRKVKTLSLPNAFPKENRKIFCTGDITSTYRQRNDPGNKTRIINYIDSFADTNGNLAVYFPSYDMLRTYSDEFSLFLKGKEVFIEPNITSEATIALNRFLSLPRQGKSGILFGVCGGKWSEGLDYRGELLNGAMVIGLPLAPFNPVRRMVIDYFRKKFGPSGEFISYTLPAMNRALQALGRVLRTPKDTGVLVLGDARFLEARVRQGLPVWMQEEMMPCTVDEFTEEIRAWR